MFVFVSAILCDVTWLISRKPKLRLKALERLTVL